MKLSSRKVLQRLSALEGMLLCMALMGFWFPSNYPYQILAEPVDRSQFVWILLLIAIIKIIQLVFMDISENVPGRAPLSKKIFQKLSYWFAEIYTPLLPWLIGFIVLAIINTRVAPYPTRGLFMLVRPVTGLAWVVYLTERYTKNNGIQKSLLVLLAFSIFVGLIALMSTEWIEKSEIFMGIINFIPRPNLQPFVTSFNANEIGGTLAWLVPFSAGLTLYLARGQEKLFKFSSIPAFIVTFGALFLGQSRFAIFGVLMGLYAIVFLLIPKGPAKILSIFILTIITVFQFVLIFSRINYSSQVQTRDEVSFVNRFSIWGSALNIIKDYPLTGVGVNNFRISPVRQQYPASGFDYNLPPEVNQPRILPHAHNEILQTGADMGILGMVLFIGWHFAAIYMLWICWRKSGQDGRVIALSLAMGLGAHAFFGLGDAIPIWDRTNFIHWLLLGLVSAQYKFISKDRSSALAARLYLVSPSP